MSIEERMARLEVMLAENTRDTKAIRYQIEGNGTPGLKTRIDRIEQRAKLVMWGMGITLPLALGAVGTMVYRGITADMSDKITHPGKP
jgi:hypothetical protein